MSLGQFPEATDASTLYAFREEAGRASVTDKVPLFSLLAKAEEKRGFFLKYEGEEGGGEAGKLAENVMFRCWYFDGEKGLC